MEILYLANENTVALEGLADVDGNYIDNATVTLTAIRDAAGAAVAGSTVNMAFVAGSNGVYRGKTPETLAVVAGQHYTAVVDAETPGGDTGHWEVPLICRIRS